MWRSVASVEAGSVGPHVQVDLLATFALHRAHKPFDVPRCVERLLAFLAIHDRPVARTYVAGSLWPESSQSRAAGALRSTLWRLHALDPNIVETTGERLRLERNARVDLREGTQLAQSLVCGDSVEVPISPHLMTVLQGDLLPDWYAEDWLVLPREQWRQLRMHALEALAALLAARGQWGAAVLAALAAIEAEPLRESAHRCLARVHLAEGNAVEAVETYKNYGRVLERELGLVPSSRFADLVAAIRDRRGADRTASSQPRP